MFPPSCLSSVLLHLGANWSRQRTLTSPGNLSPSRCQMQGRDSGPSFTTACTQITPDDLSHVRRWPLSHLPVTPVLSSCLPLARVTLGGCALASLVKPKRWPGILSFDPCVKGALVTRLHSHDWVPSFFFLTIYGQERRAKSPQPTKWNHTYNIQHHKHLCKRNPPFNTSGQNTAISHFRSYSSNWIYHLSV